MSNDPNEPTGSDEPTGSEQRYVHFHLWRPAEEQDGSDRDLLVDTELTPTGYYADYIQYGMPATIDEIAFGGNHVEIRVPYPTKGDDHALYEWGTYAPTERLRRLRGGEIGPLPLEEKDVLDLYAAFCTGSADAGFAPTLVDFGMWLAGKGAFEGQEPAEIVW